jgi:hypothetical protein
MIVPAGKLLTSKWKSTVPDWMAPDELRVRLKVMTAVPRPLCSAFVTGDGLSFAGRSVALNTTVLEFVDGDEGLSLPHPAASTHVRTSNPRNLIGCLRFKTFERD